GGLGSRKPPARVELVELEADAESLVDQGRELALVGRQACEQHAERTDGPDGQHGRDDGDAQRSFGDLDQHARAFPYISTTSNCSGAYMPSLCKRIGLPVISSSSAMTDDSSSSSRSMTAGRASTSSSSKSNCRSWRKISRKISWQIVSAVFTNPRPSQLGHAWQSRCSRLSRVRLRVISTRPSGETFMICVFA